VRLMRATRLMLGLVAGLASVAAAAQGWTAVPGASPIVLFATDASGTTLLTDSQRSTDGGVTWLKRTDAGTGGSLFPSLTNPSQVYSVYGTADDNGLAVQFSSDGGSTWTNSDAKVWRGWQNGFNRDFVSDLEPVGNQPGRIYAVHYVQGCGF